MESIVLKPDKLEVEYDKENDVLYISAGKRRVADDSIEPQEGFVIGTRKGELVGITIIRLRSISFPKRPRSSELFISRVETEDSETWLG